MTLRPEIPSVGSEVASLGFEVVPLASEVEPLKSEVEPLVSEVEPLASEVEPLVSEVEPLDPKRLVRALSARTRTVFSSCILAPHRAAKHGVSNQPLGVKRFHLGTMLSARTRSVLLPWIPAPQDAAERGVSNQPLGVKRFHLGRWLLALACAAWASPSTLAQSTAPSSTTAQSSITAAGNAAEDTDRLAQLRIVADGSPPGLDAPTHTELLALLPAVAAWAEGRALALAEISRGQGESHRYLHNFFENGTARFDPPFPPAPRAESAVYPLWALYRGRFLTWYMLEHSEVLHVPEKKRVFIAEAERCFAIARRAFPDNPVLKMYGGEQLPAPGLPPWDDLAPDWANHQRRSLEQLHRIILWWIAERQLPNGEFGGKWGDDVEMWRWWAPVLIGFDDRILTAAQERLASGNLARPALAGGYTRQLTDVEHTSEETADTLTPMVHVYGNAPEWAPRVRRLLQLADAVWWGQNRRGQLQFKHIDFNHERLGADPTRAYDTGYHVRVMQPALLLWQRTGDPSLGASLTPWLRTWATAALGTEKGKPAGVVPAALQWPSGEVGSAERGWVGPRLAGDAMEGLYSWPGYPVAAMTTSLLQAYFQTGEPVFLEPLRRMAALRRAHLAAGNRDGPAGSPAWAAHRLPRIMNDALAKWRQFAGDREFDDLLLSDANGYVRFLLDRTPGALTRELANTAATLSVNWPMFTSEVRYTDRVLAFPRDWPQAIAHGGGRVDTGLLYSTVTGDPGAVDHFPLNGARWHTLPRAFAVLVAENQRSRFTAELFHFGGAERALGVTLLTLDPGRYGWRVLSGEGRALDQGELTVSISNRRLAFNLPARVRARLVVERTP